MPTILDPDLLADGTDIVVNTTTKTIRILTTGAVDNEGATGGVTGQALYSWLKEEWKSNAEYIKFPFPMEAITPEQFEFINGWLPFDDATRKLIRTAGWTERSAVGAVLRRYMGVVSLGSLGATDQPYYRFGTSNATNFTYQGPVNEAVQIFGDASNGNFDFTDGDNFDLYCREQGKTYAYSNNTQIGAPTLTYIVYRFPLSNGADLKISASDATIATALSVTAASWAGGVATVTTSVAHGLTTGTFVSITGVSPSGYNVAGTITSTGASTFTIPIVSDPTAYVSGGTVGLIYSLIDVEYFGTDQLFDVNGDAVNEPYRIIIEGATFATTQQIYEKVQYLLRQDSDIDSGAGTVNGKVATGLLSFVGDTLVGANGVYISNLNDNFLNSVDFYDHNGVLRRYPFVSAGTINFGANAGSGDFIYRLYFSSVPSGDYGTANALIVNDKDGAPISGTYSGSPVPFSFAYDTNVQGGRTQETNAAVTLVGLGLEGGQFASVEFTITRSQGISVLLAPAVERNYSNPV